MQHRRLIHHAAALVLGAASLSACADRPEARATEPAATTAVATADGGDLQTIGTAGDEGYRLYQFRSEEDPSFGGDPTVCPAAPFTPNVFLNATLWTTNARASDGLTATNSNRRIGTATACAFVGSLAPGYQAPFYVAFDTPAGRFTASGTCALVSNNVPTTPVVLAGCNLRVVGAPAGYKGGEATSASIFNPARVPGVATGSYWTLLVYADGAA